MIERTSDFVIITGGPGAGKTTLIAALAEQGLATMPEAGRAVIREQSAIGGQALPWADRMLFAERMFAADLRSHQEAKDLAGPVIFDRGIPDIVGYLRLCGLSVPDHLDRAARHVRYAPEVFLAPPWQAIYESDSERRQDYAEAERTCAEMVEVYARYGYSIAELPRSSVAVRVGFVLDRLGLQPCHRDDE